MQAADGGIIPGGIIVAVDGCLVRRRDDLDAILERHNDGETVPLKLLREGQVLSAAVTLLSPG